MITAFRLGFAQVNPTVGDLAGNTRLIIDGIERAKAAGCGVVLFPEMTLTGYPPEDLLLKPTFIKDNIAALKKLAKDVRGVAAVIGFVDEKNGALFNAAAWVEDGRVKNIYHKQCLPNYGVFDEKRYFSAGHDTTIVPWKGIRFALSVCEDIWIPGSHLENLRKKKPDVVLNISASPFHKGKMLERQTIFKQTLRAVKAPLAYCNLVGGQDELVFDGGSFVLDAAGKLAARLPAFETHFDTVDFEKKKGRWAPVAKRPAALLSPIEEIHRALVLGVRDYVGKNKFSKVALGLSGGIDSALVAAIAAEALGPQNVTGVTMPSRFNTGETKSDAALVAKNLGISFLEIPIQPIFERFLDTLAPVFKGTTTGLAEENLQARIRGSLLMAMSNKFGWLILTTGNKSEMSTGYCTLYGDTAGGFAVIKDVLKTTVYELSRFINKRAGRDVIPETTITRPPTAELRENQKDEDSLGAYADLDPLLVQAIEKNRSLEEMARSAPGKEAYVKRILSLIDISEYKRRQAPPGVKITPRSFGRDYRMPITNRYRK